MAGRLIIREFSTIYVSPAYYLSEQFGNAKLLLSTTKEVADYDGPCMYVRRVSDDAKLDIGFVGKYFDVVALTNFLGASQGRLERWYDQEPSANHAEQLDPTRQLRVLVDTDGDVTIMATAANQGLEIADDALLRLAKPHLFAVRMRPQLLEGQSSVLIAYTPTTGAPGYTARWGLAWNTGEAWNGQVLTPRSGNMVQHTYGTATWSFDCANFFVQDYRADTCDIKLQSGIVVSDPRPTEDITYSGTLKLMIGNSPAYDEGCNGEKFRCFVLYDTADVGANREAIKDYLAGADAHDLAVGPASLMDYTDADGFHWKTETRISYYNVDVDANGINWKNEFGGFPWSFKKATNIANDVVFTQIEVRPADTDMIVNNSPRAERVADVVNGVTSAGWSKGQTFCQYCQIKWLSGAAITSDWFYQFQSHTSAADSPNNITFDNRNGNLATVVMRDNVQRVVGDVVPYGLDTWYGLYYECFWSTDGSSDTLKVYFGPVDQPLVQIVDMMVPQKIFYTTETYSNFKQGIYAGFSGNLNDTIRCQYANHKISLTPGELQTYITSPPPLPSTTPPAAYTGQVATRTWTPNTTVSAPGLTAMQRSFHYARDAITSLQVAWPAWYVDGSGNEVATGGITIKASIEYPAGTFTQINFSGSATGSIASGATLLSDPVSVNIPKDAKFFVRSYQVYASDAPYLDASEGPIQDATNGDALNLGGGVDQTMSGTVTGNSSNATMPLLIVGNTIRPSVMVLGDSKASGYHDSYSGTSGDLGEISRSIGPNFAYASFARPSQSAGAFVANGSRRAALGVYFSHLITDIGGAEVILSSQSWSTALSLMQQVYAMFPTDMKKFVVTWAPASSSSDGFATTGNQTTLSVNAQRLLANAAMRAGLANIDGYFEVADAVESARDSGIWKANYTDDGFHETNTGALAIVTAKAIPKAAILR